jgi:hypothetical protein
MKNLRPLANLIGSVCCTIIALGLLVEAWSTESLRERLTVLGLSMLLLYVAERRADALPQADEGPAPRLDVPPRLPPCNRPYTSNPPFEEIKHLPSRKPGLSPRRREP